METTLPTDSALNPQFSSLFPFNSSSYYLSPSSPAALPFSYSINYIIYILIFSHLMSALPTMQASGSDLQDHHLF